MKLLEFIKGITESDEELLAIIEEINRWVSDNEETRSLYIPNNVGRFNFSRDEHKQALNRASQAIKNRRADKYHKQHISSHRESENPSNSTLFW